jgi:hypothetical protein
MCFATNKNPEKSDGPCQPALMMLGPVTFNDFTVIFVESRAVVLSIFDIQAYIDDCVAMFLRAYRAEH